MIELSDPVTDPSNPPIDLGEGAYFLWHLVQMGLLDDAHDIAPEWQDLIDRPEATRVAIIDNGMARDHPNITGERILAEVDFSRSRYGVRYRSDGALGGPLAARQSDLAALNGLGAAESAALGDHLQAVVDLGDCDHIPNPAHRFGNHGTAIAGLVAGRPSAEEAPGLLPYYGVDPTAQILSIDTLYNHEFWPVIQGLIYAYLNGADVIVMPRPVADLERGIPETVGGIDDLRKTRLTTPGSADHDQLSVDHAIFEALLAFISERIPVVVAAGNTGLDRLEYPGSLVDGVAPHLIVATGITHRGHRSSFACHVADDPAAVIHAPSNDGILIDREFIGFHPDSWAARHVTYRDAAGAVKETTDWSRVGVVATDIPGEFGYGEDNGFGLDPVAGDIDAPGYLQQGSFYTLFGGTSSSCALVGGLASLLRKKDGALTGAALKAAMTRAAGDEVKPITLQDVLAELP